MEVESERPLAMSLSRAEDDGFFVKAVRVGESSTTRILFAGKLADCLTYIEQRMAPPPPAPSPEELEKYVADARFPSIDYGVIWPSYPQRPEPVDLSKIGTGGVDREWEAGARVALERRRAVRARIVETLSHTGPALAVWLTPEDRSIIVAALRNMDAQNDGTSQKDFK